MYSYMPTQMILCPVCSMVVWNPEHGSSKNQLKFVFGFTNISDFQGFFLVQMDMVVSSTKSWIILGFGDRWVVGII